MRSTRGLHVLRANPESQVLWQFRVGSPQGCHALRKLTTVLPSFMIAAPRGPGNICTEVAQSKSFLVVALCSRTCRFQFVWLLTPLMNHVDYWAAFLAQLNVSSEIKQNP